MTNINAHHKTLVTTITLLIALIPTESKSLQPQRAQKSLIKEKSAAVMTV